MKTLSILLTNFLILLSFNSCNGQSKKMMGPFSPEHSVNKTDTLHQPQVQVKVNREFDSKGNLTRYDSTYSYTYKGGTAGIPDSILNLHSFMQGFDTDFFKKPGTFFLNDSLFKRSFFEDNFFKQNSDLEHMLFDGFVPSTDSLHRQFWNHTYRKKVKTI